MRVFSGHTDYVRKIIKASADTFLTISDDSTIKHWSIHKTKCLTVRTNPLPPHSTEGDHLSIGLPRAASFWDTGHEARTGESICELRERQTAVLGGLRALDEGSARDSRERLQSGSTTVSLHPPWREQ